MTTAGPGADAPHDEKLAKNSAETGATVFPPTLREVMLRPAWLGVLGLCLVVAAVFAFLGQWQLERAIDTDPPPAGQTEVIEQLEDIIQPGLYLTESRVGQKVELEGSFVADDFRVLTPRYNDGEEGYWVVGQLRVDSDIEKVSIAAAVGWTADRATADAATAELNANPPQHQDFTGRIISDEGPAMPPRDQPHQQARMSPAALLPTWHDTDNLDVYRQYLTTDQAYAGLDEIYSPSPTEPSSVNWLNLFYALEWAVFAGFAFYMWYRLAKDAWEKELEALEEPATV